MAFAKTIGRVADIGVEFLWPSACSLCQSPVSPALKICRECWCDIAFLNDKTCTICGGEVMGMAGQVCDECQNAPRPWDFGGAATVYQSAARRIVLLLKDQRNSAMAELMAGIMRGARPDLLEEVEALIAVPVHWTRRLKRGYNQAELIAEDLSKRTNIPVIADALLRKRITKYQAGLEDFEARFSNLENAIALNPKKSAELRGKTLLLIDDVMTSGASFDASSRALRTASPKKIGVFAFARVGDSN